MGLHQLVIGSTGPSFSLLGFRLKEKTIWKLWPIFCDECWWLLILFLVYSLWGLIANSATLVVECLWPSVSLVLEKNIWLGFISLYCLNVPVTNTWPSQSLILLCCPCQCLIKPVFTPRSTVNVNFYFHLCAVMTINSSLAASKFFPYHLKKEKNIRK